MPTEHYTTLIYKGQKGNWAKPYQVWEDWEENEGWEVVGTSFPELRPQDLTMEYYVKACRQVAPFPEAIIDQLEAECELIPITITY